MLGTVRKREGTKREAAKEEASELGRHWFFVFSVGSDDDGLLLDGIVKKHRLLLLRAVSPPVLQKLCIFSLAHLEFVDRRHWCFWK